MSLKDNFNQAVKDLLKKDGFVGDEPPKENKKKSELDKYLEPTVRTAETTTPLADALLAETESEFSQNPYVATPQNAESFGRPISANTEPVSYSPEPDVYVPPVGDDIAPEPEVYESTTQNNAQNSFGTQQNYNNQSAYSGAQNNFGGQSAYGSAPYGNTPPPTPKAPSFTSRKQDTPYFETEETTVISRNTVIDGNIRSFANITIDGSVKGDVKITKNINVSGKVVGDIECNNSTMSGASMQGNILSKGQVQIDRDSLLLGDISTQYLDLNGKIKGNIDCGGKAEFKTDAIILGNITASTITVLDGATIQGYVNTTFLQESSTSVFPEAIAVTE